MSFSLPAESVFLDLSDRAKLRLTGADRLRFLNGQVSNDVRRATADTSVYTGVMTAKGKLCADAFVHAGDDFLLLDAEDSLRETLAARLERYVVADDVQIEDVSEEVGLFHVLDFAGVMDTAASSALPAAPADLAPGVRAVHSERYGRRGLDLFFDAAQAAAVHERLALLGVTQLNEDALESLRILLGVPRWGAELDENTMPAEAGLEERAVSYSKGCYLGQEVVSRVKSVGHVNRQLRGLRALDASPLYAGRAPRRDRRRELSRRQNARDSRRDSRARCGPHCGSHCAKHHARVSATQESYRKRFRNTGTTPAAAAIKT